MEYFDTLETRDPEQRERELFAALPAQIAHAKANAPHFATRFADVDPHAITSRRELAALPLTRKSEMHALQQAAPPFGGLAAIAPSAAAKIFVSAGPIYEPEGKGPDYWRLARALYAAGFRAGDVVQNCFSYHLSPAASMLDGALLALGCPVIPGGTGQTEIQAQTIAQLGVVGYVGTPSFLKLILEKADEMKLAVGSLRKALVSGEAFPPSLRDAWIARGIQAYQAYAIADLGTVAYESAAREGLLVDEGLIVEIVRPGTGDPVPDGEVGEVVVTTFSREYPLIRFATGDLSAVLPGRSPCGRTNMRIRGWMGRADQATKVRGLFVHPHQIAEVIKRFPAIQRARVVVDNPDGNDRMRMLCALTGGASQDLRSAIEEAVRDITRMRGEVEFVDLGLLPNDGKVIEDVRKIV
ncbi:MAG: phenylacetate--CoA ligase family protein [Sulfurifustis sp.]